MLVVDSPMRAWWFLLLYWAHFGRALFDKWNLKLWVDNMILFHLLWPVGILVMLEEITFCMVNFGHHHFLKFILEMWYFDAHGNMVVLFKIIWHASCRNSLYLCRNRLQKSASSPINPDNQRTFPLFDVLDLFPISSSFSCLTGSPPLFVK